MHILIFSLCIFLCIFMQKKSPRYMALLALRGLTLPDQIFSVDAAESAQALTTGVGNSDMDEMEL